MTNIHDSQLDLIPQPYVEFDDSGRDHELKFKIAPIFLPRPKSYYIDISYRNESFLTLVGAQTVRTVAHRFCFGAKIISHKRNVIKMLLFLLPNKNYAENIFGQS